MYVVLVSMRVTSHRDLIVWQRAMDLVAHMYKFTETLPQNELYGLCSQMQRAAVSIPSNIAEGRKRGTRKDFRQFLILACGSGAELETQVEITRRLSMGNSEKRTVVENLLAEVMRMLNTMIATLAIPTATNLKADS